MKFKIPKGYRRVRLGEKLIDWWRIDFLKLIDNPNLLNNISNYLYYQGYHSINSHGMRAVYFTIIKKQ